MSAMQATYDSLSAEAAELLEQERAAQAAADAAQAQAVVEASARQAQENANASGNVAPGNDPSPSPSPAPSEPSGPSYNPVTGNAIVDRAYGCIGLPYSWGGVGPSSFDCSGLVSYAVTGSFTRWGTTNTFMGMVAGRRSSTWRYRHQLGPLRYLHRQRPDDPCSNLRPDGVHQPGAG